MKSKHKFIVGIDEAGRGPLAGPVCVGAVAAMSNSPSVSLKLDFGGRGKSKIINYKILKNIKDSKKLNAKNREKWQKIIKKNFECHFTMAGNMVIDNIGIDKATLLGVKRVLKKFSRWPDLVLMDGSLKAPKSYAQKTIIRGDEKIPLISAASIIAKVVRDKKMIKLHKKFPKYRFDVHKGYGTKTHYEKIKKNGLSKIHRKSFCKKLTKRDKQA